MRHIHLISGPRNISTALMYSFAQRKDTSVVDELFYGHFLKQTGIKHPGYQETMQSMSCDWGKVVSTVIFGDYSTENLFIKNMAKHLIELDTSFMQELTNLFLIREPANLIASFAKVVPDMSESEIAYKRSWELFQKMQEIGNEPIVLDSGLMLSEPTRYMKLLCESMKLSFDPNMMHWTPGPIPEDGVWAKYWYGTVHKSSGFEQRVGTKKEVPQHLQGLLEEVIPYYEKLLHFAIKA